MFQIIIADHATTPERAIAFINALEAAGAAGDFDTAEAAAYAFKLAREVAEGLGEDPELIMARIASDEAEFCHCRQLATDRGNGVENMCDGCYTAWERAGEPEACPRCS